MTDHHLVPHDDPTPPGDQGEVPDWFDTSEESAPIIGPAPAEEPIPSAPAETAPAPDRADQSARDEVDQKADEELDEEPEPVDESDAGGDALVVAPPVGTRRRRPVQSAPPPPPTGRGYACADVITAIFLLLTILVLSATILLIANPRSPLNPFPPPTFPALLVLASPFPTDTPTQTLTPEPATPTLATPTPSASPTRTPTPTPTVTNTPVVGGAVIPTSTVTARVATQPQYTLSPFPFTVKSVLYVANSTKEGCDWQSIAGSVLDLSNKPIKGLAVRVTGANGNIDEIDYSGTKPNFGESGFEIFLGAKPVDDQYTVQLIGRTGSPISDTITVETHTSCDENIVVVNFVQNHAY